MRRASPWRAAAMRLVTGLPLVACVLLVLPGAGTTPLGATPLAAQDTPAADTATHTVRAGETLSGIAEDYLGSFARWPEILELNRDRVSRPELLLPGTVLRLPASARAAVARAQEGPPEARLVEIDVTGGRVTVEDVQPAGALQDRGRVPADYLERRGLLERRPFVAADAPEPPESTRTIFFGTRTRQVQQENYSEVVLARESELPVVQHGVARSAGWIVPIGESVPSLGEITGFVGEEASRIDEASVLVGEEVRSRLAPGSPLAAGDRLTTVRTPRRVNDVGQILVPTGEVEVLSIDGDQAVLRLERSYNRVQIGQFMIPVRALDIAVGVRPSEPSRELVARILAFEDSKALYLAGDRLFVDVGARDGVSVGDAFTAWADTEFGGRDSGIEPSAEFQVIRVQDGFATLRITRVLQPRMVQVGTLLHLTAAMP
jgi:LysM repeat protein